MNIVDYLAAEMSDICSAGGAQRKPKKPQEFILSSPSRCLDLIDLNVMTGFFSALS